MTRADLQIGIYAAGGCLDCKMSSRPGGSGGIGETGWLAEGAAGSCLDYRMSSRPGGSGGIGELGCWLDGTRSSFD